MSEPRTRIWVGVDAGKGHHFAVALDDEGGKLLSRKVVNDQADQLAAKAVAAAESQHTTLPGEKRAAAPVRDLAHRLLELDAQIKDAEFFAIVGDLSGYAGAGRLAAHAGLAPVPRDSGRRTGNLHRPKNYNRRLRHVFYMAAQTAMMRPGLSRDYYLRKRSEGKIHTQAVMALARRRIDVLWAMLRDHRAFSPEPPLAQAA